MKKSYKSEVYFPIIFLIFGVVFLVLLLPEAYSIISTDVPDEGIIIQDFRTKKLMETDEKINFSEGVYLGLWGDEKEMKEISFQYYPIFDKKDDRILMRFVAKGAENLYATEMETKRRQDIWDNVNEHILIKEIRNKTHKRDETLSPFTVALKVTAEKESPLVYIFLSFIGVLFAGFGLLFILPALTLSFSAMSDVIIVPDWFDEVLYSYLFEFMLEDLKIDNHEYVKLGQVEYTVSGSVLSRSVGSGTDELVKAYGSKAIRKARKIAVEKNASLALIHSKRGYGQLSITVSLFGKS